MTETEYHSFMADKPSVTELREKLTDADVIYNPRLMQQATVKKMHKAVHLLDATEEHQEN